MTLDQQKALALASARLRMQESPQTAIPRPVDAGMQNIASAFQTPQTRLGAVVQNSAREAVAGFPDMFLNAPTNLYNLGKAAYGTAATAMGHPDLAPDLTEPPDFVRGAFQKRGWIKPQAEPQTTGERYLAAGTTGAVAGAPGGLPGMLVGAGSNIVGQGVSDLTGSNIAGIAANLLTAKAGNMASNYGSKQLALADELRKQKAPLTDTMNEVRNAGYVMPPSMTNPTVYNRIMEGLGGKAATEQDASMANDATTAALVRNQLRAPSSMGITEQSLGQLADERAQIYRDVAALPSLPPKNIGTFTTPDANLPMTGKQPQSPSAALEKLRSVRLDAKDYWREFQKNGSVDARNKYVELSSRAAALEGSIEKAAVAAGHPEMVDQLRAARTDIAQIHDVERALNTDRGEVSAIDLARARDKGVPLSGDLLTAAKMGNAFHKAIKRPEQIGSPGVNNLVSTLAAATGGGIGAAAGNAPGAFLGAALGAVTVPAAQLAMRKLLLSGPYQRKFGTPSYNANLPAQAAANIPFTRADEALLRAYLFSQQQKQGQP